MKSIVGVDPGRTTGLCFWDPITEFTKVDVPGGLAGLIDYTADFMLWGSLTVIVEDFLVERSYRKSIISDPLDILGYLRGLAVVREWDLVTQRPEHRLVVPEADLKQLGIYYPVMGGHGNQAARHVIRYLRVREEYTEYLTYKDL